MKGVAGMIVLLAGAAVPVRAAVTVTDHAGARAGIREAVFIAFGLDTVPFRRNLALTTVPATEPPAIGGAR